MRFRIKYYARLVLQTKVRLEIGIKYLRLNRTIFFDLTEKIWFTRKGGRTTQAETVAELQ